MTQWLAGERDDSAQVRLFCFAHAGGGPSFFRPWRDALAPEIDVCAVHLPGRESRLRESAIDRMDALLDELVPALRPFADRDVAVFGHSLGAAVGYEFARRLEREHGIVLRCLVVSGRRAPHLPARRDPLHDLPEADFLAGLRTLNGTPPEVLADPTLLELFAPTLRADFAVNETYEHDPDVVLHCPIAAVTGDADPEVDLDEIARWRDVTTGSFSLRVFAGDHFYLKPEPDELLDAVRNDVLAREVAQTLN
ncbi:medium-chain acyl-[acyl-carrier-protein] hydrolase [Jatrophihabitans endophyticus]|uniref:Medium-chain acyl-[acyl-carrier-protein] hydrolase n=1 Tax=Jatrophihabitans endophyticus TaxID=1206085 RepID=A0A1M5I634_9ACTN|nr:alpha/beta fold hydrolase [Jatrophihabitans endophyticus]SHG23380.1 medium-chain acyl-[acyl-carrier-protein] hydrolase [Jatrophihabitans endophyticus]